MRSKNALLTLFGLIFVVLLAVGGCSRRNEPTEEPPSQLNATQSFETAVARVTEFYLETAAASAPTEVTATPEPETPTPTATEATPTETSAPPTARPTGTSEPCDRAAPGNPIDVTIPDDTQMTPGQTFRKTWRLVNVGTCTWNNQYAVVWVSGEQMGDEDVVFLSGSVAPGQSLDITVPMTAPTGAGNYQSNWKLRNSAGVLFGIGEKADSVFWVRIKVAATTATPTITPTPTQPSVTTTAEPVVFASNTVSLVLTNFLELDNISVNPLPALGQDLSYITDLTNHYLVPLPGASIGVYGAAKPGLAECKAASLGGAQIAVESVGVNAYLCYKTDAGRYGRLQISSFNSSDGALSISAVTWANP